jgi:hypothetical protein
VILTVPPIVIDTSTLVDEFTLDQDDVNKLLDFTVKQLTARFAEEWEKNAIRELKSSRQQYINSLVVVDEGQAKGAVVLVGQLPNMIEQGVGSFDMKEGILKGPNAKISEDGKKYNTIPFSIGTPGALEENFNGGVMPEEIHSIAKKKEVDKPITSEDLKTLPKALREPQKKKIVMPESKSFREYQHKNSIYEGITKTKDSVTGQTSYQSFRRVSENSDPDAFIHPGIDAHNIAQKTLDSFDVPTIVGESIDMFLEQL